MKIEIGTPTSPREARENLRVLVIVLVVGIGVAVATIATESRRGLGYVSGSLVFLEVLACMFLIAAVIQIAREPSLRKLGMASFGIIATPFALLMFLELFHFLPGGHDHGGWSLLYFTWTSVLSGVSLLLFAGIRLVIERRKDRSSRATGQ